MNGPSQPTKKSHTMLPTQVGTRVVQNFAPNSETCIFQVPGILSSRGTQTSLDPHSQPLELCPPPYLVNECKARLNDYRSLVLGELPSEWGTWRFRTLSHYLGPPTSQPALKTESHSAGARAPVPPASPGRPYFLRARPSAYFLKQTLHHLLSSQGFQFRVFMSPESWVYGAQ